MKKGTRNLLLFFGATFVLHFMANFTSQMVAHYSDRVEVLRSLLILAIVLARCLQAACKPLLAEAKVSGGSLPQKLAGAVKEVQVSHTSS
jgi:hypothetical protein